MQADDFSIIESVLSGRRNDYKKLVVKYQDMVMSIAVRVLQQREEAEDTAQICFLKAYEKLATFKGDSLFSTWLYRISYHTAISRYRQLNAAKAIRTTVFSEQEIRIADEFTESITEGEDDFNRLEKAMQKLEPEERGIISLFYTQELAVAEITKIIGLSESNVKVKLFRIRKKLAQLMEEKIVNQHTVNTLP